MTERKRYKAILTYTFVKKMTRKETENEFEARPGRDADHSPPSSAEVKNE
jgi:hypothetical protein